MPALRCMAQQQFAVFAKSDEADMEIIQVRLLRDEADDVAGRELRLVGQQCRARDDAHRKPASAERTVPIDGLFQRHRAIHGERPASLVLDVVLAPLEEIMIALAPGDDAVVVAYSLQSRLEADGVCLLYTSPSPRDGLLSR